MPRPTSQDLAGYWDMLQLSVEDVSMKFDELHQLKLNDWKITESPDRKVSTGVPRSPSPCTGSAGPAPEPVQRVCPRHSTVSLGLWLATWDQVCACVCAPACMHVCVNVCPHLCACACTRVCICACVCVCTCVPVSVCISVYGCVHPCACVCVCACVHMCVFVCMFAHINGCNSGHWPYVVTFSPAISLGHGQFREDVNQKSHVSLVSFLTGIYPLNYFHPTLFGSY